MTTSAHDASNSSTIRAAIYARVSSDQQAQAIIEYVTVFSDSLTQRG